MHDEPPVPADDPNGQPPPPPDWGAPVPPASDPPAPPGPWHPPSGGVSLRYTTKGLATALTWLLGASAVIAAASAVLHFQLRGDWLEITENGTFVADLARIDEVADLEGTANSVQFFSFLMTVAVGVVFIVFAWRVRKNIETFGASASLAAGWAIGSWFVPCASYVLPFIVMRDSWAGSQPARQRPLAILGIWWALWVVYNIATIIRFQREPDDTNLSVFNVANFIDDYTAARGMSVAAGVTAVVAAIAAIAVVRTVDAMQRERAAELASAS